MRRKSVLLPTPGTRFARFRFDFVVIITFAQIYSRGSEFRRKKIFTRARAYDDVMIFTFNAPILRVIIDNLCDWLEHSVLVIIKLYQDSQYRFIQLV